MGWEGVCISPLGKVQNRPLQMPAHLFISGDGHLWDTSCPFVILIASRGFYAADLICWDTTASTRFDGIPKPTPFAGVLDSVLTAVNVGMPMNSPCKLTSAPPLLPGLMGASISIALAIVFPPNAFTLRFIPLIIPS